MRNGAVTSAKIQAGAVGIFPKTMTGPALVMALKLALSGQTYVPWSGDLGQPRSQTDIETAATQQEPGAVEAGIQGGRGEVCDPQVMASRILRSTRLCHSDAVMAGV